MKTKTTKKRKATAPVPIEIRVPEGTDLGAVIRDAHLAQERRAYDGLNAFVAMGGNAPGMDFMRSMVAYSVLKSAEQVLRIEDELRTAPARRARIEEDIKFTREHYARTLAGARQTLGLDFDRLYMAAVAEHNANARQMLDSSNGTTFDFIIPKFNDDGTHEPLGPRDFPWGMVPNP